MHRTRPSLFIEKNDTRVVIDTGPDFRQQINRQARSTHLDAVLYSHAHYDHVNGIADLRSFSSGAPIKRR
jgi:phosphoribosyl 1,2-cyclic phosphate phosphodiesterase